MSEPIITVENVSKKFELGLIGSGSLRENISANVKSLFGKKDKRAEEKEFWALRDINFNVYSGDVIGIIGRNGAGKSTLLKVLSQITEPTTGRITLVGRVASLLEVGTGFHPELTGRENIYLNGGILGMPRKFIKSKFEEIVEFSGVSKFIDTPVKRYSSGMYVRLAFAVAAHLEPEILVIDEVLSVGDSEFQKKCLGKMDSISQSGRTILYVSHNLNSVVSLCNKAIHLVNGQIYSHSDEVEKTVDFYLSGGSSNFEGNLLELEERSGNGACKFSALKVFNSDNPSTNTLRIGDSLSCEIDVKCFETIHNPNIKIIISNAKNDKLFIVDSLSGVGAIEKIENTAKFTCKIPNLFLNTGEYFVSLMARSPKLLHDKIENVGKFNVMFHDVLETGATPKFSNFVFNNHWKYEQEPKLV